jgi:hypothetical protein
VIAFVDKGRSKICNAHQRIRVLGPEGAGHHAKGLPMPPELFTSDAERTAWRKTHQTIRTSNADVARRVFLAAYREASQAPARHLHSIEGGAANQLNAQEA